MNSAVRRLGNTQRSPDEIIRTHLDAIRGDDRMALPGPDGGAAGQPVDRACEASDVLLETRTDRDGRLRAGGEPAFGPLWEWRRSRRDE